MNGLSALQCNATESAMNTRDKNLAPKTPASHSTPARRKLNRRSPSPLALEARLMFDGAAAADIFAVTLPDHPAAEGLPTADVRSDVDTKSIAQTNETPLNDAPKTAEAPISLQRLITGDTTANGGRREIAFVDSAVENWQTLVDSIRPGIEVLLIDARGDGLTQIADYLDQASNIDAVHIISHGQEGEVILGNLHVNASTLSLCETDLARIGNALVPGGDLLLYGCDIAKGDAGLSFIGQLSQASGADVAASIDPTGNTSLSGNWVLEASTGRIEAITLLTLDGQANYAGELALPGVHTGSNSSGIFLGGNYIELGIRTNNSIGKFGADTNPGGAFTGRTNASNAAIAGIGMVGDADGFGTGAVLNIDYFMPGTPEEGFYAGYKIGGVATTGKNFGATVTNTSSGNTLSATVTGTVGGNLGVSQVISFDVNDLFFKNVVTLTNTGGSTLDNVRFMRSFDPDDTVDKSGSYSTINTIEKTNAAGDGVAVVSARSSTGDTYYTRSGSKQASILYYSSDSRAKVGMATSGLAPSGVYDANIYDSSSAKGTTGTYDAYISIAVDVGSLAAGASTTFTYYTSLDNRDINTILSSIAAADSKTFPSINEDPGSNAGSGISSVFGSAVAITAADNTHGQWQYSSNGGSSWSNFGSVTASSARLLNSTYTVRFVPDADWNGGSSLTYRTWDGTTFTAGTTTDASSAGTHFSANTANASITVNAVNDVPLFTKGANQTISEDAGAQTISGWATGLSKGGGSDEASQTLSFNVSNNNSALFSTQPAIDASGNLSYTAAAGASGTATVTVSIRDTGGTTNGGVDTSATQTFTITVNAVNDAPVLSGTTQTLAYAENALATPIDSVIVVTDPDSPSNLNGGYLQTQITSNGAAEDQLSILNQGVGVGQIGVSGSAVTYGGVSIGSIDAVLNGLNGSALRINLNSGASTAATQALARVISYQNSSEAPSTSTRTVTYTLNDGGNTGSGGALSGTRTATITISAVDDPTVLTLSSSNANYVENNTNFYVDASLTLSDADSTTMNGAKVIVGAGFKSTEDQLSPASGTNADGITYSYDSAKGVLTLSGSATIAQYQAALRAVKYNNTSENPDITPRTITITLGNAVSLSIGGINHYYQVVSAPLSWTAAKTAAEGLTFQGLTGYLATITSQTENDFIREKLTADAWIGASDSYTYINAATGSSTYASQAAAEGHWYWVSGPEAGTRISDGNGSPVTVSGGYAYWNSGEPNNSGSAEHYGEIYSTGASPGKWNDLPNTSTLAYVVEYSDTGGTPSFSKSLTITPQRVNDAPVTSGSRTLTSISEDATTNSGQLISSFLSASDPDTDPVTGIAITTLNSSNGTWQYSLDNGAIWSNVGSVSDSTALLLRTTDRVRFVPDGLNADTASITYRGWDRTNENSTTLKAGQKADVSSNGGITAYASGTQIANITVTAVNDAPTLASTSPSLTGINEDAVSNSGQSIASFLGGSITDVDSSAQQGVAITSLSSGNGTWEYSINAGSSWVSVGTVAGNNALVLRDTDLIRFRPDGQNGTSASFSYKAWDRSAGTQGNKLDTTVSGGSSAFSTNANTASITVSSVNDAPVLSGAALSLASISENNTSSAGQTVASLLGSSLSDVDSGAVQGVAITGSSVVGTGYWEFDAGSGWTTLGSVSDSTAMLLRASDKIRFVPDTQHGGSSATLTLRGWDTTTGTAGSTADASIQGGSTAFSAATSTASIAITEINDAPVFNTPADASSYTEQDSAVTVGNSLVLSDDSGSLSSASVRIKTGFTAGDTLSVATPGGLTVNYNASTGVLSLSGTASTATYQTALRSVTFSSSSDDPTANATTRTLEWQASDSANATSLANSTLSVIPSADAPSIAGAPASWSYVEDDGARIIAPTLSLSDADDSQLSGASVIISGSGYMTDGREVLAAVTTGTGITASFDASTGTLTLSGTDSVANYQKVLRSVTYINTGDYENPSNIINNITPLDGSNNARSIQWQVTDANSDGASGSPSYGAQSSSIASTTITLYNANETPQVSNVNGNTVHIAYTEGGPAGTLEGVLAVADDGLVSTINSAFVRVTAGLEAGDTLGFYSAITGWTQSGSATSGTLTNDSTGAVITYSWSLASGDMSLTTTSGSTDQSDYTAVMQKIGFVSNSDDPTASNATRTLIWRVTDSGGLQSAVTAAQTSIIDITATNDTASVSGASLPANGDIVYIENGATVALAPSITLIDPDDTTLASASIVISGTGFDSSAEYLALPGATVTAGSDWTLANINGSGISASFDHTSGTLSLSGSASMAAYQTILRQISYGSSADDPTASANTRTISWTLTDNFGSRLTDADGGGNDSASGSAGSTATSTVTLSPRNDAPSISGGMGGNASWNEGGAASTLAAGITLADIDDTDLSQAQVWISTGFSTGDTLNVASPGSLSVSYNGSTGVLTLSGTASKASYEAALQSVQFSSSSADPSAISATREFSWQVTDANAAGDGALTSSIGNTTLDITANDNPASITSLPTNGSISFTENGSPVVVAPALALSDADDTRLASASVAITSGFTSGDVLALSGDFSAAGISVSYDSGTGVLSLSGPASLSDFEQALRAVIYRSSSDDPTSNSATRTLSWTTLSAFDSRLTDATAGNDSTSGNSSSAVTSQINLTALNDAPVLSLNDGSIDPSDAPVFEQGSTAVFAVHVDNTNGGVSITDADLGDQIASASVQITNNLLSTDTLSIATPAGWSLGGSTLSKGGASVNVSYNSGSGTLTLTGIASRSDYEELLGSVKFANSSVAPTASGASRELSWSITDTNSAGDGARSASSTSLLTIRDRNDAPSVSEASPSASYTEGAASIAVPQLTITDPDPGEIVTATLTVSIPAAGTLTTPGGASYNATTGVWTLTDTVANVNAALAALSFLPETNNDVAVTLAYSVADGGEDGAVPASGSLTLNVIAVNDAPILSASAPTLPPLTEDQTSNSGLTVSSFRGAISDVDTGTQTGIALTDLTNGNGSWQYSLDGSTWSNVGTVSASSALALRDSDYLRFVPNAQNATTGDFTYRAWDGSGGSAGNKLDASSTGNATPFSNVSDTASITVTAVNDAPTLSAASPVLASITEDDNNNAGHSIASVLGASVNDVDSVAVQGIAIDALSSGNGVWEYSLDAGSTWAAVGSVSVSSSLLLSSADYIRFVPDTQNATTANFSYRAWDRSSGAIGSKVDSSINGGVSAYSSTRDTASISVTAVNDAPVLAFATPSLTSITEDETTNAGQTVASIIASTISDVDNSAVQGIVLTGSGSNNGSGSWQYSTDGGSTWTTVGALAANTGILLRDTDKVRFIPDALNANVASINYRAWDRTNGSAGSTVSTAITGGSSEFSLAENTASITITAVNDAPINDVPPTFSGGARGDTTLRQDGVVTADPETWHDVDIGDPATTFRYQWQIADDASGTGLHDISGATALTYTLNAGDIGKYLRVQVFGSDGTVETVAYSAYTQVTNIDPVANLVLAAQETSESVPISFTLPSNAFTDANVEDTLYYTATLADGSPLPSWLTFDPITLQFNGTPTGADTGVISIRVTASDHGQTPAYTDFTLRVLGLPVNQPANPGAGPDTPPPAPGIDTSRPVVLSEGGAFLRTDDTQALSISAVEQRQTGDSFANSPTQGRNALGDTPLHSGGLTRPDGFRIFVEPSPNNEISLLLVRPLSDQFSKPSSQIRMTVPADTFVHTLQDALITLTASRTNGATLPAWLHFDALKGEFRGTPPEGFTGDIELKVLARDNFGNEAVTTFRFRVHADKLKTSFSGKEGLSAQLREQAKAMTRPAVQRAHANR